MTWDITTQDALEFLRSMKNETVDLCVTDPPYESLEKHRKVGTTTRLKKSDGSSNEWFDIFPNKRFPELFRELYRVLRKNSHLYMFSDQETMFVVKPMAEAAGFKFWKPLVWDKEKIGMGYHYRARYEFVLFFEKGKRKLKDLGMSDVFRVPRIHGGYPTEKPVGLVQNFVEQSSNVGELVIDPFCGSCPTGQAAVTLHRHFEGCDISERACKIAANRLGIAMECRDVLARHQPIGDES